MQQAHAAHHVRLLAAVDDAAAAADVVGVDGVLHLRQREAVAVQFCGIEFQHELRRQAAEIADVSHAAYFLQARDDCPELQLRQFAQGARFRFQRVAVDFARGRSIGIEPRLGLVRQVHAGQALLQALAREVAIAAILEHDRDQGQREQAARAQHMHAGRAQQGALQRYRDLLFDFLGAQARHLRDNLRGDVGDVGIGFDGQLLPAIHAVGGDEQQHQPDDAAPLAAGGDETVNH